MATRSITFRDVISFSAEHPQNRVQNLLKTGKTGKWTSPKHHPEATIDVELSLPPCYIKSLDVGNHWTAVLEIEVGRSNETNSKREALLKAPSTLMSRIDCQIGSNKDAMKFYTADDDFTSSAKNRWVDRIRFVCRQSFRRDVLFGLSTVAVRGISVDDLDAHGGAAPAGYSSHTHSPPYTSGKSSFESSLKNVVGLAGLASAYQNKSMTASSPNKSNTRKDISDAEVQAGVANLKSKINKQTPKAPVTPKAKYASLFASLDASTKKTSTKTTNPLKSKPQKQSPAQSRKRKAHDNDEESSIETTKDDNINLRKSVITFMRNIDPGNEFGYKELTRLWIAEKGHPQTNEERTILKEVAKNHTYGKPQKCEPTPPQTPSSPKSAPSSQQNKKFVFKKKAAVAAAKEAAEKAAAEKAASTNKLLYDGSNGKCKRIQNDLQDIQFNNKSAGSMQRNTIATYDAYNIDDEPLIKKGPGQGRRKSKKKSIEELLGPSAKEITTLDNKFDSLLQSPSPQHIPKKPLKDIRSKYDNFDYESSSYDAFDDGDTDSNKDIFVSPTPKFKVPQDYVKYNDDEVKEIGILVQVRQYKKDKYLPLTDGSEVKVEKGTFVTFYKNAHQIHMKINEKLNIPDVEPEHIAGIFKDYTEKEIADSDRIRSNIRLSGAPKATGLGILQRPIKSFGTIKAPVTSPINKKGMGSKNVSNKVKEKKKAVEKPAVSKGKRATKKKIEEKTEENQDNSPPPIKKSKKTSNANNVNNVAPVKKTPAPKKLSAKKAANTPKSARKTPAKRSKIIETDSGDDSIEESPPGKTKTTSSRKRVSNAGGECPLCSRTFSRTRDLMEHCSTCEGTSGSSAGTGGSSGGRSKGRSKTPKPVTPKANLSDCPICSKKVPSKDIERHARLCAENMFG